MGQKGFAKSGKLDPHFTWVQLRVIFNTCMFIFQTAEVLAVKLLIPGNLPENLQPSNTARHLSCSLDRVPFRATLLTVVSQQQMEANNYTSLL